MSKLLDVPLFLFGERRGHILAGWCRMCKNNWETEDHLLLHCEPASKLWVFVFKTFGIFWVIPASGRSFTWLAKLVWETLFRNLESCSALFNVVLWQERNSHIFEDMVRPSNQLPEHFSGLLFDWSRSWGFTAAPSLPEFIASLNTVLHPAS